MFVDSITEYTGALLHQRFAFQFFREKCSPLGNIIAFRGPMEVVGDNMIDQEDVLDKAFIWSDDAINFLWEIPILGNSPFGAVAFQRLFNTFIANKLAEPTFLNKSTLMKGDDIYVQHQGGQGKSSVSITHVKDHVALGHTGINIQAGKKAPLIAYSTELNDNQAQGLMEAVISGFYELTQDLFNETSKVLVK